MLPARRTSSRQKPKHLERRVYVSLDGETFTAERAVEVGSYLEMDRAAVAVALEALRRAELVVDGPAGMVTTPPGNVPF